MIHDDSPAPAGRDPFGRLTADDGSRSRLSALGDLANLKDTVGRDAANDPDDVARVEMLLEHAGVFDLKPSEGPTGFVGERLLDAIVTFQKRAGMAPSGIIRPGDATHLSLRAHAPTRSNRPDPVTDSNPDGQPAFAGPAVP